MTDFPDRLSLIGIETLGRHGALPEEQVTPQPFQVDVILHADLRAAAESDDLAETADYGRLTTLVRGIVEGPSVSLIEALAGSIATAVLAETDPRVVDAVEVRVRKPEAPLDVVLETVEAAIVRRRPDIATG